MGKTKANRNDERLNNQRCAIQDVSDLVNFDTIFNNLMQINFKESVKKYSELFNIMNLGFAMWDVIYDTAGNSAGLRLLEVNESYEKQMGRN